jgi:hypothetical protein
MDNGLIFPYPRVGARDEPVCANHPNLLVGPVSAGSVGGGAWDPGR